MNCANCNVGNEDLNYLHLFKVRVFNTKDDYTMNKEIVVKNDCSIERMTEGPETFFANDGKVKLMHRGRGTDLNVALHFDCENCRKETILSFEFHKGGTYSNQKGFFHE